MPKTNTKPVINFEPKASSSPDIITHNSDMRMDLESESWVENKEKYSSDQDEIPEKINHFEKF